MCRLLGRASRAPMTDADVIGADGCAEFQRLGRLHGDGWGTAWLVDGDDGATLHRLRDPDNPTHSAALTEALVETPARARITHLRFATEGLATQLDNTHPFVADGIAFAHNGSVPVGPLGELVGPEELAPIGGSTDSAMIFALILRRVRAGESLFDAVLTVVADLRQRFPESAINLLLLTASELIAAHANAGATVPYEEFAASGLGDDLPIDHIDHYYRMSWRRSDGAVMITSSGLPSEGWTPIDQHTAVRVDLETLGIEARPIATATAGRTDAA